VDTGILFNGQWLTTDPDITEGAAGKLSLGNAQHAFFDRINSFGDGVFETMLVNANGIHLKDLHLARLQRGLQRLDIAIAIEILEADLEVMLQTLPKTHLYYRLKLMVSRGESKSGYSSSGLLANRILSAEPASLVIHDPVNLMRSSICLSYQPALAGIKHCNRLEQVLAKQEQEKTPYDDALLFSLQGELIEAISSNVFILEGNSLVTPMLNGGGVKGVMREFIKKTVAVKLNFSVNESVISLERLCHSDGLILTNSMTGVRIANSYQVSNAHTKQWLVNQKLEQLQAGVFNAMNGNTF